MSHNRGRSTKIRRIYKYVNTYVFFFISNFRRVLKCSSFWVIPRRLNIICRRFGTLCSKFISGISRENNRQQKKKSNPRNN